jgi:hypothetical protein
MPVYDLKHIPTGEVDEHIVSISKMEEMVASGDYEIQHLSVAKDRIITQRGGTLSKTSGDWRDLLGKIKKGSGRNNSIKTY